MECRLMLAWLWMSADRDQPACCRLRAFRLCRLRATPLHSVMSLASLPDVLAQSIAHFLNTKERLALARCSRQNRILAQAPFTWIGADPLTIEFDGNNLSSSPLLRFIPVSLVWGRYVETDSIPRTVCNVIAIADRIHLVAIHDGCGLSALPSRANRRRIGPGSGPGPWVHPSYSAGVECSTTRMIWPPASAANSCSSDSTQRDACFRLVRDASISGS